MKRLSGYKIGMIILAIIFFGACNEASGNESAVPEMSKDYLLGKFDYTANSDFVEVDIAHANRSGMYLRIEAYEAFLMMVEDAQKAGIKLIIISATRNFKEQKEIWEAKWNGYRLVEGKNLKTAVPNVINRALIILKYSSMPGTSRHHWGTDFDLNALENSYFASGTGLKIYNWLLANASKYGFGQPYTAKGANRPNGYEEEKWHWSYLPLSSSYLHQFSNKITYTDIVGFAGSEAAKSIDVITKYVMGINRQCY